MIFRFKLVENLLTEEDLTDLQKIRNVDSSSPLMIAATKNEEDFKKKFNDYIEDIYEKRDVDKAHELLNLYKSENVALLKQFEDKLLHVIIDNFGTGENRVINNLLIDELLLKVAKNDGYFPLTKNSNFFKNNALAYTMDYYDTLMNMDNSGTLFSTMFNLLNKKELPSNSLSMLFSDPYRYFGGLTLEQIGQKLKYYKMIATQSAKRRYKIPDELNANTLMIKGEDGVYQLPADGEKGEVELLALKPDELAQVLREYEKNAEQETITLSQFFKRQNWEDYSAVKRNFIDGADWLGSSPIKYKRFRDALETAHDIDGDREYKRLISNIDIPDEQELTVEDVYNAYLDYVSDNNADVKDSIYYAIRRLDNTIVDVESSYNALKNLIRTQPNGADLITKLDQVWVNKTAKDSLLKSKVQKNADGDFDKELIRKSLVDYLTQIKTDRLTGEQILTSYLDGTQPKPDDYRKFVKQVVDSNLDYLSKGDDTLKDYIRDMRISLVDDGDTNAIHVDNEAMFETPILVTNDDSFEKQLAGYILSIIDTEINERSAVDNKNANKSR